MFYDIMGWLGTILVLLSYILLSFNIIKNRLLYQLLNLISSILMGIGLYPKNAWFSFYLQVIWAIIAILSLVNLYGKKNKKGQ